MVPLLMLNWYPARKFYLVIVDGLWPSRFVWAAPSFLLNWKPGSFRRKHMLSSLSAWQLWAAYRFLDDEFTVTESSREEDLILCRAFVQTPKAGLEKCGGDEG